MERDEFLRAAQRLYSPGASGTREMAGDNAVNYMIAQGGS